MRPTTFTRDGVWFGPRFIRSDALTRDWRCGVCGGRLIQRWLPRQGWLIACGRDPDHSDFIHETALDQRKVDALHILDTYGNKGGTEMPIKDLQKRVPMLKRGGIIRLGYKEKKIVNDKEIWYPVAADHFVLKDAPDLTELYGPQPRLLNVLFPFDDIDRVFQAWHQRWRAGGLQCRGDGDTVQYAVDPNTGRVLVRDGQALQAFTCNGETFKNGDLVPCPGLAHDLYPKCKECSPNALLILLIREKPRLVYYQLATTSKHNIVKLTGQLEFLRRSAGRLTGIPLILELRPEEISTPSGDGGKRVRRTKYLLSLEPDPQWVQALLTAQQAEALPGIPERVMPATEAIEPSPPPPSGHSDDTPMEPPLWEAPLEGEDIQDAEWDEGLFDANQAEQDPIVQMAMDELGAQTVIDLPAWAQELRAKANSGPGASDPITSTAAKGLVAGLARKLDGDSAEARVRAFIRALWRCGPEELTKAMYNLTVNLNGEIEEKIAEILS